MHIPVRFGLVGPNGADLEYAAVRGGRVAGDVIHLTAPEQTLVFEGVSAPPVPSLLRGFSAPVKLAMETSPDDLLFLLRTDADSFNRWQASQRLANAALLAAAGAIRAGRPAAYEPAFIDALAEVAENDALEPAFRAQVLAMPGEADIAREIGRDVDPDAVADARNGLRAAIADRIGARLAAVAAAVAEHAPFSPDAASAGRRALANVALDLTAGNRDPAAVEAIAERFHAADNMTDRVAALSTLALGAFPERTAAFDAFHDRYRDDALVLDKWFTLQAAVPAPTTLDDVVDRKSVV